MLLYKIIRQFVHFIQNMKRQRQSLTLCLNGDSTLHVAYSVFTLPDTETNINGLYRTVCIQYSYFADTHTDTDSQ